MRLALNEGYVDSNPCSGLALDVKPGDVIPRRSFSLAELTRLFSSPIYGRRAPCRAAAAERRRSGCL